MEQPALTPSLDCDLQTPLPASQARPGSRFRLIRWARRRPSRALLALALLVAIAFGALFGWREATFRIHRQHARTEVERGHNAAAARHLEACRAIHPENAETLLLSARVCRRGGLWEDAGLFLDRYWQLHGDDEPLIFERLLLRATRGELETSAPLLLDKIEANGPNARAAREALITGLLYRFRWIEAERNLAAWSAAAPDDTAALLLRGKLQEQRSQTSEALLTYRRIVELDPEHDEARLRMTTILLQLRQTEDLLDHVGYLRTRLPDLPEVQVQWAKALALQGRTDEAKAALEECRRKHPDYPAVFAELGSLAFLEGDDKRAEEYLAVATRLDPGSYSTRQQYSLVLARSGRKVEAAREQESIRQLETDQQRINELIGGALQSRPKDPSIPHEIGAIALRSGQPSEGLRWLQAAIQIDANYGPSHDLLAGYYQNSGNPALAARHRALAKRFAGTKPP